MVDITNLLCVRIDFQTCKTSKLIKIRVIHVYCKKNPYERCPIMNLSALKI